MICQRPLRLSVWLAIMGAALWSDPAGSIGSQPSLSLANGAVVGSDCNDAAEPGVQHVAFAARATHKFLGYGVQLEAGKAKSDIEGTVATLRKLGLVWVKIPLAKPDEQPVGQDTGAALDADLRTRLETLLPRKERRLLESLHAAGIKVVDTIHRAPGDFFTSAQTRISGKPGWRLRPETIPQLASYYAAYLRAMAGMGIRPDLIELINEPNLAGAGKFSPEEYAELLKTVETDLQGSVADANLSGPATASARVPDALSFVQAMAARNALAPLKAITLHTYYVRDRQKGDAFPPADEPAFRDIVMIAEHLAVPMISTEFGGTDVKTKVTDPEKESVDTAEEMKAALDLIRNGESAAIVWSLHQAHHGDKTQNTWALIDSRGPTNAYWIFDTLGRGIPVGSEVLAVSRSDITPAMTAPGYAAFRNGNRTFVGLSNPSPHSSTIIDVSFGSGAAMSVTGAAAPLPDRTDRHDGHLKLGSCKMRVSLPAGAGALVEIDS